ncbi:helicase-related protein [Rhodococcus jostii]|uniref:helicase-related protein n=1 Tax=Rhodococcus jostii TaxID=132919 RepID=UPI003665868A
MAYARVARHLDEVESKLSTLIRGAQQIQVQAAEAALANTDPELIEDLTATADRMAARVERVSADAHEARDAAERARQVCTAAGYDVDGVDVAALSRARPPRRDWRDRPATDRQQAYLRTLRRRRGLPVRLPDDLTIGRADEQIKVLRTRPGKVADASDPEIARILAEAETQRARDERAEHTGPPPTPGQARERSAQIREQLAAQRADRENHPPQTPATPVAETAQEDVPGRRPLRELVAEFTSQREPVADDEGIAALLDDICGQVLADETLNLVAGAETNTFEQFTIWAARKTHEDVQSLLAEQVMSEDPQIAATARAALDAPARWQAAAAELPARAWAQHHPDRAATDAAVLALEANPAVTEAATGPAEQFTAAPPVQQALDTTVTAAGPETETERQQLAEDTLTRVHANSHRTDPVDWRQIGADAWTDHGPGGGAPIPAADPRVQAALDGVPVGDPRTEQILTDWNRGWHGGRTAWARMREGEVLADLQAEMITHPRLQVLRRKPEDYLSVGRHRLLNLTVSDWLLSVDSADPQYQAAAYWLHDNIATTLDTVHVAVKDSPDPTVATEPAAAAERGPAAEVEEDTAVTVDRADAAEPETATEAAAETAETAEPGDRVPDRDKIHAWLDAQRVHTALMLDGADTEAVTEAEHRADAARAAIPDPSLRAWHAAGSIDDRTAAVEKWRAWAYDELAQDPLVVALAASTLVTKRSSVVLESAAADLADRLAGRPDLAAVIDDHGGHQWLTAEVRGPLLASLEDVYRDKATEWLPRGTDTFARTDRPRIQVHRFTPHRGNPIWEVTTDGGESRELWGGHHLPAVRRATVGAGQLSAGPIRSGMVAEQARGRFAEITGQALREDEVFVAAATSPHRSLNRTGFLTSQASRELRARILTDVERDHAGLAAACRAHGLDMSEILRLDVAGHVFDTLHTSAAEPDDLFSAPIGSADLEAIRDSEYLVGAPGPGRTEVHYRWRTEDWEVRGAGEPAVTATLADAISTARTEQAATATPPSSAAVEHAISRTGERNLDDRDVPDTEPGTGAVAEITTETVDTAPRPQEPARNFTLGTEVLAPSGAKARARANLDAIALVHRLDDENRAATAAEQRILAAWSGWGAVPNIFDKRKPDWDELRTELATILTPAEIDAARASTLNAHYTDPTIAAEMWTALGRAGFTGGRVLEPGCGAGNFMGHAPRGTRMVGVELDPMTARIAHHLYPGHQVRGHGFEKFSPDEGAFTAVIGNVPFGNFAVGDPLHNPSGLTIHNHFVRKSLALTEVGGYVAVITSAFTSDAQRTKAREEITELGDLVGALRLPTKAFDRQAGTDVVTDLLIFRRREAARAPSAQTEQWITTAKTELPGGEIPVNDYFLAHPENVLGELGAGTGRYAAATLKVVPDTSRPLADQVRDRLTAIVDTATAAGLGHTAEQPATDPMLDRAGLVTADEAAITEIPGSVRFNTEIEQFEQLSIGGRWAPVPSKIDKARTAQWKSMLAMAGTVTDLVDAQRTGGDEDTKDRLRAQLNRQYDAYTRKYGPLNRYTWITPGPPNQKVIDTRSADLEKKWRANNGDEIGPVTGDLPEDVAARLLAEASEPNPPWKKMRHLEGAIRYDPAIALVRSIEIFDEDTGQARKSKIFTEDVITPPQRAETAQDVAEALAVSLDETGRVDLNRIAGLVGIDVDDARTQLDGLVFPDPQDPTELIPATRFLSGNVREKLAATEAAAKEHPQLYSSAVEALRQVIPPDQDPTSITVRPGANWVPEAMYEQFIRETFSVHPDTRVGVEYSPVTASWDFTISSDQFTDPYGLNAETAGDRRGVDGLSLLEKIANNQPIRVLKTEAELEYSPKPRFHEELTEELQQRAVMLETAFGDWLFNDPARAAELTRVFNDRFNSFVDPKYDGQGRTFPGLRITPHPHQAAVAVRQINEASILLDHTVGTGKTWSITMCAMEMRRLGQVKQPWVVVPNHLVDQWAREVADAYPGARVLVGDDFKSRADRQLFMAQSASQDWDLVIVPEPAFTKMQCSVDTQAAYIADELAKLEAAKEAATGHNTIKEIEKAKKRWEEKLEKKINADSKDVGFSFEQTGCDYLFLDEAHMWKNLQRQSNNADLALREGSSRATDLDMKLSHLRRKYRQRAAVEGRTPVPEKVVTFATGTPVANSMSELWVMTKYLRPDLLEAGRMGSIDAWAANFAAMRQSVEMNVTGNELRSVSRIGKFVNLPALMAMNAQFTDVVTRDQVPVVLPEIAGGGRQNLSFELPQQVRDFMIDLDERMQKCSGRTAHIDNKLKIGSDGLNVTLDPRLGGLDAPPPGEGRVDLLVNKLWEIEQRTADNVYYDDTGAPDPRTGGLQIVFLDRGTPKPGQDDTLYDAIRADLVARGMSPGAVQFIQDYPKPKDKRELFAACRRGEVKILIGSSEAMSTGMNVQKRAIALFHVDCPWKPADLEQREGRIIRQGNQNKTVEIINMVGERSYDTTKWQTVERKSGYIEQLRCGRLDVSEAEDIGGDDMTSSMAATKAAATGDPRYIEVVELETQLRTLNAEARAHRSDQERIKWQLHDNRTRLPIVTKEIEEGQQVAAALTAWGELPRKQRTVTVSGHEHSFAEPAEVRTAVQTRLAHIVADLERQPDGQHLLAAIAGAEITVGRLSVGGYAFRLTGGIVRTFDAEVIDLALGSADGGSGMVTRLTNMAADLPAVLELKVKDRDYMSAQTEQLADKLGVPFTKDDEISRLTHTYNEMRADLAARENSPEALAEKEATRARLAAAGMYPGWTRDLNPTRGHAEKERMTQEKLREITPLRMMEAARKHAEEQAERAANPRQPRWQRTDDIGSELTAGFGRDTGDPGAVVTWTGRDWYWSAHNERETLDSGTVPTRDAAIFASEKAVGTALAEAAIPPVTVWERDHVALTEARANGSQPAAAADTATDTELAEVMRLVQSDYPTRATTAAAANTATIERIPPGLRANRSRDTGQDR